MWHISTNLAKPKLSSKPQTGFSVLTQRKAIGHQTLDSSTGSVVPKPSASSIYRLIKRLEFCEKYHIIKQLLNRPK